MDDKKMKELILDYLDGNLSGELKEFVANHIKRTDKWRLEYDQLSELTEVIDQSAELEPPPGMKDDFKKLLADQDRSEMGESTEKEAEVIPINQSRLWLQIAASVAILVVGIYAGYQISNSQSSEEIAVLRQEMESTKQLVLLSLQNQSASSRLNAVNVSNNISDKDDDILNALVNTLNNDSNANVRLAALEALSRFADDDSVRKALIASLASQDKPVVQIALIDLMVGLKEEGAREALQMIVNNEEMEPTVRDEANYGLLRL